MMQCTAPPRFCDGPRPPTACTRTWDCPPSPPQLPRSRARPCPPLHHDRVPGLDPLLHDNRHDCVLGLVILLHNKRGPCVIRHLHHNHVLGLDLLFHHGCGLGLVLLLRHTRTTCDLFNGVCPTLDLNVGLLRSYSKLMEELDSPLYFCSRVTKRAAQYSCSTRQY